MAQTNQNPFEVIYGYLEEQKEKLAIIEYQIGRLNLNKDTTQVQTENLTVSDAVLLAAQNATPIKTSQIYKYTMLANQGKSDFPCQKFGKRVVIPRKLFLDWLKKNTVETSSIENEVTTQLVKAANKKLKKGH